MISNVAALGLTRVIIVRGVVGRIRRRRRQTRLPATDAKPGKMTRVVPRRAQQTKDTNPGIVTTLKDAPRHGVFQTLVVALLLLLLLVLL